MKTLHGIDDKLKHFEEALPDALAQNMPTYRKMFCNVLGAGQAANGDEALAMFGLGLKIRGWVGDSPEIEDSEFALLQAKVSANPLGWMAHFLAQVLLILKEAEAGK